LTKKNHQLVSLAATLFVLTILLNNQLKLLTATFLIGLLIYHAGSVAKFLASFMLSYVIFTFLVNLNGIIEVLALPQRKYGYSALALVIIGHLVIIRFWKIKISLSDDVQAFLVSISTFALLFRMEILEKGGAIAAIFPHEDNAAWVLTSNAVNNATRYQQGNYGTFVDMSLLYMGEFSKKLTPELNPNDYLALGIVTFQLLVIILLPFLVLAVMRQNTQIKRTSLTTLVPQVGSVLIWLHFMMMGHLTAAISSIMLLLTLIWFLTQRLQNQNLTVVGQFAAIIILYQAGSTWFPLIPVSVVFILFFVIQNQNWSLRRQRGLVIFAISIVLVLVSNELITRFSTFKTEGKSWITGAFNLIEMEGGVASTGVITFFVVSLVASAVGILAISNKSIPVEVIIPIGLLLTSAISLRFVNSMITQGPVNYGVRKFESVIVLVTFTVCLWIVSLMITKESVSRLVHTFCIAPVFFLLLQLPVTEQLSSRGIYKNIDKGRNFNIAISISENVERGDSVLCLNGFYQAEVYSELRLLAYGCSRWSAAYSDTDGLIKNEWRKAVLGAIRQEQLGEVKNAQQANSKVLIVGPAGYQKELNPDWELLIDDNWSVFEATD
jgi:hypothetical protein